MKEYYQYIKDVQSGKIKASLFIKQQVDRLEKMKQRDDIYFDEECVRKCFEFVSLMKHFSGKSAGQQFNLLPWQKWVVGSVIGIKYKDTGFRVCKDLFLIIARKNGKTSICAAIALYMLLIDGEQNPQIGLLASSREQARICFEMITNYAKTLDPNNEVIKIFRNYIKCPTNLGEIKVYSSDSSKLDGTSQSIAILDETHSYKDNKLYSVMKSSMGFRNQGLMIQITTAGFLTEGYPCFETYKMSMEILADVKQQDSFFPFMYMLDVDDDWTDEENWIKCNPCLDITITRDYLRDQVIAAKNDATQEVPVKTKNFNIFCQASTTWIPQEMVAKTMKPISLEDMAGYTCYLAADLGSVNDLTSLSAMWVLDAKYYFKTWTFLPSATLKEHPNKELYEKFIKEGSLIITPGNVTDYDYVIKKMDEVMQYCPIEGVYYDKYNATQWAIQCTELGYNMHQFGQNIGNMNKPTKEIERLMRDGRVIIDKSTNVVWQFGNAVLKTDINSNSKIIKDNNNKKIDSVVSMITALGGYLENPIMEDFTIIF